MITTNFEKFLPDIKEVVLLFGTENDFNVEHFSTILDGKIYNKIQLSHITVSRNATTTVYEYEDVLPQNLSVLEEKRLIKRFIKLSVYKALNSLTGKSMPWGALTGIRPTKLAYQNLKGSGEFYNFFTDVMQVSKQKTDLVDEILSSQQGIYVEDDDIVDFFAGIPFCPTRCSYCSFISNDLRTASKLVEPYVDALVGEIAEAKKLVKKLRSVYIGGGTPVTLRLDLLERVLKAIDYSGVEFTVEAGRPDCITEDSLKLLKDYAVTRICVNPQTFNDKTLVKIGRKHTADDVVEKFALAKKYGFDVNMDLIAGLPGESFDDFAYSIDKAISLKPENITVHTLCLKKGADLKNENERLSGDGVSQMVEYSHKQLHQADYLPYYLYRQKYMAGNLENTGYALKGKACVYNIDVMEEIADNIACGANAVSKVVFGGENRIERYANPKDVKTYIDKIETIKEEKNKLFAPKNIKNK